MRWKSFYSETVEFNLFYGYWSFGRTTFDTKFVSRTEIWTRNTIFLLSFVPFFFFDRNCILRIKFRGKWKFRIRFSVSFFASIHSIIGLRGAFWISDSYNIMSNSIWKMYFSFNNFIIDFRFFKYLYIVVFYWILLYSFYIFSLPLFLSLFFIPDFRRGAHTHI